MAVSFIVGGN